MERIGPSVLCLIPAGKNCSFVYFYILFFEATLLCSIKKYWGIFLLPAIPLLSLLFISGSSHQQRGFRVGVIYALAEG